MKKSIEIQFNLTANPSDSTLIDRVFEAMDYAAEEFCLAYDVDAPRLYDDVANVLFAAGRPLETEMFVTTDDCDGATIKIVNGYRSLTVQLK